MESIRDKINDFVGIGGNLPFEHGFDKPTLNIDGKKIVVYSVANNQVRTTHNYYIPLEQIEEKELKKLFNNMVKYIEYCINEA